MHQPGIEVRPLRQMTGSAEFNEVFFDGARTAKDNVLGPVGEGWKVAMATLGFERGTAFLSQQLAFQREFAELLESAHKNGAAGEPALRDELAQRYIGVQIMKYNGMRMLTNLVHARRARPGSEHRQALLDDVAPELRRDRDARARRRRADRRSARRAATTSSTSSTTSSWRAGRRPSTRAPARSNATSSASGCSGSRENPVGTEEQPVNFAFSEEQEELRRTVRQFLEAKSPETEVRRLMETTEGYDPAVWKQMGQELGLQWLAIPEEYGGQGFTFIELGIVLEEMGRVLLCAPYFSSVVLAANAILNVGTDDQKQALLPGIASGDTIATLAFTEPSRQVGRGRHHDRSDRAGRRVHAVAARRCSCSTATPPTSSSSSRARPGRAAPTASRSSPSRATPTASPAPRSSTMDMTRKQAKLEFDNVAAEPLGAPGARLARRSPRRSTRPRSRSRTR